MLLCPVLQVTVNPDFDQIGQKGREEGIGPDQADLGPRDGSDQAETIGGQEGSSQLGDNRRPDHDGGRRSEEHTSELQSH